MTTTLSKPRSTLLITAAILILIGAAGWAIVHKAGATAAPAVAANPISVSTAAVQQQDVPMYLTGVGTVTSNASVTVKARIDGQLDKVGFVEGEDVKAGQLLVQIDPRTLQAQLDQALAQRAKDQAQLANSRLDLQRYTTLVQQDAATQQTLDATRAQVNQLQAAVQADEAQINYAKVQLSFTKILAPISGRVGARLVDPGNIVHAADANGLVVINQIDPIAVVFTLPEESFQSINAALRGSQKPLSVQTYARNSSAMLAQGNLALLNNQIDTSTGTVQLKGIFQNPSHVLWPGQYVNVRLILGDRKQALTLPAAAVQRSQDGTYVYIVKADSTVNIQPVQVANIQEGLAVIDKGLTAGQRVVVDGQYKLKPGIKIMEAAAGSAPPQAQTAKDASNGSGSSKGSNKGASN
ncbi:efflux RND transporter periplasmic adaptor subunit [Collimonas sp.]|jgi:multidrug efflux system membrane fusion protein|uniref:efflux RND transporter periplasmic adaptor subunit n=1 Tax=Collimonas sp. TaxID=1963772 RepID=UPI002C6F4313|nr:efflux RND transporter periplasmic adaptor subunit [Collimonas sp.]HWW07393.1 efflux RND transporter periplasmic adaptor subunit [Collimonas sp.]